MKTTGNEVGKMQSVNSVQTLRSAIHTALFVGSFNPFMGNSFVIVQFYIYSEVDISDISFISVGPIPTNYSDSKQNIEIW